MQQPTMATKTTAASSTTMSPASLLFATSKAKQFKDFSKPYKNEAFVRLRNSTLCLVTLVLLTYLLPVPSLWTALNVMRAESNINVFWAVCAAGMWTSQSHVGCDADLVLFCFRGSAIRLARTQSYPGCNRNPISANTTPTFTFIARQKPAYPSRPEKTEDNPVSRCEYTLVVCNVDVDADTPSRMVLLIDESTNATLLHFIVRPFARVDTFSDDALFHA